MGVAANRCARRLPVELKCKLDFALVVSSVTCRGDFPEISRICKVGGARSRCDAGASAPPEPELLVVDIDLDGELARADAEAGSLFAERLPGAPVRRLSATAPVA